VVTTKSSRQNLTIQKIIVPKTTPATDMNTRHELEGERAPDSSIATSGVDATAMDEVVLATDVEIAWVVGTVVDTVVDRGRSSGMTSPSMSTATPNVMPIACPTLPLSTCTSTMEARAMSSTAMAVSTNTATTGVALRTGTPTVTLCVAARLCARTLTLDAVPRTSGWPLERLP